MIITYSWAADDEDSSKSYLRNQGETAVVIDRSSKLQVRQTNTIYYFIIVVMESE